MIFTPTVVFYKDDLAGLEGKWGRELEAIERLPLSYGQHTFYDLFVWVRHKMYERDRNFQRFHICPHRRARGAEEAGRWGQDELRPIGRPLCSIGTDRTKRAGHRRCHENQKHRRKP